MERGNEMASKKTDSAGNPIQGRDYTMGQMLYILDPWGRAGDYVMQSVVIRTQGKGVFIVLKRTVWETGVSEVAFVGASSLQKGLQEVEEGLRLGAHKWKPDKFSKSEED